MLADWLVARGDLRGELLGIAARRDASDDPNLRAQLERELASLEARAEREFVQPLQAALGLADRPTLTKQLEPRWRAGLLLATRPRVELDDSPEQLRTRLRTLLDSPAAIALGELELTFDPALVREVCSALEARPSVHTLVLGDFTHPVGELASIAAKLPNLRSVELCGPGIDLAGALALLTSLDTLRLSCEGDFLPALQQLGAQTLPKLRSLQLRLGGVGYASGSETQLRAFEPLLRGDRTPSLEQLAINGAEFANTLVTMLASSPLLSRLRTLDLSGSWLAEAGGEALLAHASSFERLERLDVVACLLPEPLQQRLQERFSERVHVGLQVDDMRWDPEQHEFSTLDDDFYDEDEEDGDELE